MKRFTRTLSLVGGTLVVVGLLAQRAYSIEEPAYTRVRQAKPFELREYAPLVVAETYVEGSLDQASNQGFRRLADYIFGNNVLPEGTLLGNTIRLQGAASAGAQGATSASSPVQGRATKIAMTAPVTAEPLDDSPPVANASSAFPSQRWRIHFVMPRTYTMATLPRPKNAQVHLREVACKRYAVVRFSGLTDEAVMQARTQALRTWMAGEHLQAVGAPQLARYDPPWTLWFLRRNEVLIEVALAPS